MKKELYNQIKKENKYYKNLLSYYEEQIENLQNEYNHYKKQYLNKIKDWQKMCDHKYPNGESAIHYYAHAVYGNGFCKICHKEI